MKIIYAMEFTFDNTNDMIFHEGSYIKSQATKGG